MMNCQQSALRLGALRPLHLHPRIEGLLVSSPLPLSLSPRRPLRLLSLALDDIFRCLHPQLQPPLELGDLLLLQLIPPLEVSDP